jgi:large repetitive protein
MKTKINIFKIILSLTAVVMFFSCENPISLGTKLDLSGPVVTIDSPTQRQSVPVQFELEGTVIDESIVDMMLITAVKDKEDFPRQWRYQNGAWQISDNKGASWSPFTDASWTGDKSVSWKITVDMLINGRLAGEGEYTFNVQAWDKGRMSDDNSFKAIVLIIDLDPPKVVITNPYLETGENAYEKEPFKKLHDIPDSSDVWTDPAYLGKFITQEFSLKWQIEDINDVWSIDVRFYKYDTVIDKDPDTPLPDNYIYRYFKNLPPPPSGANPNDYVKPNGSVTVPDLDGKGTDNYDGELKTPVPEKTTIKVVAVCYDAAGNPNQEKTLGYFISWPRANTPWIVFSEGIKSPDDFYGKQVAFDKDKPNVPPQEFIEDDVFMVYPGRSIKSTAFQAHGVKEVKYSLYKCDTSGNILNANSSDHPFVEEAKDVIIQNREYGGTYSNIFPWEFVVPPFTGYYVFEAEAFSSQGKSSERYVMLFRVHDITFPDFPTPPQPNATDPLFKAINSNTFNIHGIVSDATKVESLCLVWINPQSKDAAANSQLAYFRNKDYRGWQDILPSTPDSGYIEEGYYDSTYKNKLWKLEITQIETDYVTNRRRYSYSLDINLNDLNIGIGLQPLKSQTFLFRAENPDGKCTIITYAPQGDTSSPVISIETVVINEGKSDEITCEPGHYAQIKKFADGDTITINGKWKEDSVEVLPANPYFRDNFRITINNSLISGLPITLKNHVQGSTNGDWTITAAVKTTANGPGQIPLEKLKDTLVISTNVVDIGGNTAETGSSWLIQSDNLRLNRIYSEEPDGTYKTGDKIEIFLEFSKPVLLKQGSPVLQLNGGGTAVYRTSPAQNNQNSRQYFVYTVGANQNVSPLNVTGIVYTGTFTDANYPFIWYKGDGDEYEEVRITTSPGYAGTDKESGRNYYVRTLPTTTVTSNNDYQFTLGAGKSITIDTTLPTVSNITANSVPGFYKTGDVIYMTVNFNEAVKYTGVPTLSFNFGGTSDSAAADVKVNDKSIIFKYTVKSGNTTNGGPIIVTNHSGAITDLAGNPLATNAISSLSAGNRTLTGVCIETNIPPAPVVRLLSSNVTANDANVLVNKVLTGGTSADKKGLSTEALAVRTLTNLYNDNLYLAIEGKGASYQYDTIEYSIVTTDASWVKAPNIANTAFPLSQHGQYKIIARQTDKAGNVSIPSEPITFNWNPGNLVSRISSQTANGTYTHNDGRNQITITVYFRNNISVTSGSITLNVKRGGTNGTGGTDLALTTGAANNVSSLNFNYTVNNGDYIPSSAKLNVTAISLTATDGASSGNGVDVTGIIKLPTPSFDANKEFLVLTGDLTYSTPVFIENNQGGTNWNTESDTNYHGIRSDDGSYWTTLQITFNRTISKGSGNIEIQQITGSGETAYRLPAVLTEAQYNRFKNVTNIDTYYKKGTNGYNNSTGSSDTSTKYILDYRYNPNSAITSAAFTGVSPAPTDVPLANTAIIEAFRTAEKISIPVNSQSVTITGTGASSTLKIRLSGSNAPQVPGATYTVTLPAGLVNDELGNSSTASSPNVTLRGVAKPFIRIRKTQDVISKSNSIVTNMPLFTAAQPFQSYARMDCRTPGSTITYTAESKTTNVTASNFGTSTTPPNDIDFGPDRPANATGTTYDNKQITLGNDEEYQGFQWWVRARATATVSSIAYNSDDRPSEEKAYRTVITLVQNGIVIENANSAVILDNNNGDQIWIRGGDSIGSSSVPGFPFTWEDDWSNLSGRRAGIRLMTKTGGASLNSSTFKFVTWDINTTAYIDFVMGVDTTSSAEVAWQYGPQEWSYQRNGWSTQKEQFPIYPGRHRWCSTSSTSQNFSLTKNHREAYSSNNPGGEWVNTP